MYIIYMYIIYRHVHVCLYNTYITHVIYPMYITYIQKLTGWKLTGEQRDTEMI